MFCQTRLIEMTSPDAALLDWNRDGRKSGKLEISGLAHLREPELVAEVMALHYVLYSRKAIKTLPLDYDEVELRVSQGAVRKILLRRGSQKAYFGLASFMDLLPGARIVVSRDPVPQAPNVMPKTLCWNLANYPTLRGLPTRIGRLHITQHALDRFVQYLERSEKGDPESRRNPLPALMARLCSDSLSPKPIPPRVQAHKARKYGSAENLSIWGFPSNDLHFVVVDDSRGKTLVTVFSRHRDYA